MNMSELARKVRELSKQYSLYAEAYSYGGTSGWYILILEAIEQLNDNLESVRAQLDEINRKIDGIMLSPNGRIAKSDKMLEVEERFGKPIYELLEERKGKSARKIAAELGVSKSTIANWLKELEK